MTTFHEVHLHHSDDAAQLTTHSHHSACRPGRRALAHRR